MYLFMHRAYMFVPERAFEFPDYPFSFEQSKTRVLFKSTYIKMQQKNIRTSDNNLVIAVLCKRNLQMNIISFVSKPELGLEHVGEAADELRHPTEQQR